MIGAPGEQVGAGDNSRRQAGRRTPALAVLAAAAVAAVAAVIGVLAARPSPTGLPVPGIGARGPAASRPAAAASWVRYSADGISFDRPTSWTLAPGPTRPGPASTVVAYLATQPLPAPCTGSTAAGDTISFQSCGPPPLDLSRDGVFIDWTLAYNATTDLAGAPARPVTIADRPAQIDDTTVPGECRPTGARHGLRAAIALSATSGRGVLLFTACIGDPDPRRGDRAGEPHARLADHHLTADHRPSPITRHRTREGDRRA